MLHLSLILFLISIGSINLHRAKNPDTIIENSTIGKLIMTVSLTLPFVLLIFTVSEIWGYKWYWNILISIILTFLLSSILTVFYSIIIGYKTKPQISFFEGGNFRYKIHIIDSIITFVVGRINYFNSK